MESDCDSGGKNDAMTSMEIMDLAEIRMDCRLNRDWVRADDIRQRLQDANVFVDDTKKGCRWHRMNWVEGGEVLITENGPGFHVRDITVWQKRRQENSLGR